MAESYSVEAVLSATDKNFSKTMKGAVSSVDNMNSSILSSISGLGSKISSGLGTAVKVGITTAFAGAAATAAAGGAALVKSMNLAGDLEQNLGGSEAVFEQYASGLQNTAKDAYKNMGLSTSEYLSVANKMGSLFQGAGFDVKQSMDLSSSAMQRASDVASIMGVDQSAAMEAVAGAAKGNFTMMDNLGVAMNDTAIGAYAVSKGINKSTAEMTSQEKIGLAMQMFMEKTAKYAGNYAKENDTLAGSLGTAKAALKNFMATGENIDDVISSGMQFGKVAGKMAMELAPKLFKGIVSAVKDVIPQLPSAFTALQKGVSNVLRQAFGDGAANAQIMLSFQTMFNNVSNWITANLPSFLAKGVEIVTNIANGILQAIPSFITTIGQLISGFAVFLMTNIPVFLEAGKNLILNLVSGIIANLPAIGNAAIQAIGSFIDVIIQNYPTYISKGMEIVGSLVKGLLNKLPSIISTALSLMGSFIAMIISKLPDILALGVKLIGSMVSGLINNLPQILKAGVKIIMSLLSGINSMVGKVRTAILNMGNDIIRNVTGIDLMGAGRAIIDGFVGGLTAAWERGKEFIGGIGNWIKEHKGPISYDKRLLIGNGKAIIYGLNKGLKSEFNTVKSTVYDLTDLIATGADKINTELSNFDINIPQMNDMALAYSSSSNS
ncbi:MAG: phage tail protein, partial [Pseudolactococcus laudensis]